MNRLFASSSLLGFTALWGACTAAAFESPVAPRSKQVQTQVKQGSSVEQLKQYLATQGDSLEGIRSQPFASAPLTAAQASEAKALLLDARQSRLTEERRAEIEANVLKIGDLEMPFAYKKFGDAPLGKRSLYISMHGGGGTAKRVNDRQWRSQIQLYQPDEGIYLAPRAPTNTWNLWHQAHIDEFFDRLIEGMVLCEGVDWNRVYLMGYSAGGDGVYQLAPRMADRLAAAAMMAGHPNETKPLGFRNLPLALQMGGKDSAYRRNEIAREWEIALGELKEADPNGYDHFVKIYPKYGHWMEREDAVALPWMAARVRNPVPEKVVWHQDDVTHEQYYWLAVEKPTPRSTINATLRGQDITLELEGLDEVSCLLRDDMINLDMEITISLSEKVVFEGKAQRTIETLAETLDQKGDPHLCFSAKVDVRSE